MADSVFESAMRDQEALTNAFNNKFFSQLSTALKQEEDVLVRLNVLEVFANMTRQPPSTHPYALNCVKAVLDSDPELIPALANVVRAAQWPEEFGASEPFASMLAPQVLIVAGLVPHMAAKGWSVSDAELAEPFVANGFVDLSANIILHARQSNQYDAQLLDGALCCVAGLTCSRTAHAQISNVSGTHDAIAWFAANAPLHVRPGALWTVSSIIKFTDEEDSKRMFERIGAHARPARSSSEILIQMTGSREAELVDQVYRLFHAMFGKAWGPALFTSDNKAMRWLLDRNTDDRKIGKEAKFQLVERLLENPVTVESVDATIRSRCRVHVLQGPFKVEMEPIALVDHQDK
eukprot:c10125_g1_i1.p1 GENE.c10125_g1_i1~~c10125_g1_i1.p1  ORF type:complete len:380 (+),score=87.95 c10125_g1_i1:96-1142(+)